MELIEIGKSVVKKEKIEEETQELVAFDVGSSNTRTHQNVHTLDLTLIKHSNKKLH